MAKAIRDAGSMKHKDALIAETCSLLATHIVLSPDASHAFSTQDEPTAGEDCPT